MREEAKSNITMGNAISRLIPLVIKSAPGMFVLFAFVSIVHGMSFAGITIYTQKFIDKATMYSEHNAALKDAVIALLVLGLVYIINKIANGSFGLVYRSTGRYIQGKLTYQINSKMSKIEPIYFEDTNRLDNIQKANEGMNNSVWFSQVFLVSILFYIPYLSFLGAFLYLQKPILCITILLAFVSMIISQVLRAKIFSKLADETAPVKRECDYYKMCMTDREYYRETRILGAYHYFYDKFIMSLKNLNRLKYKASVKSNLFDLAMQTITVICYGIIIYMLFSSVMSKDISIGAFAAVYYSLDRLFGLVKEFIYDNIGYLVQDLGSIVNYIRFMEIPDHKGKDIEIKDNIEIEFRNVSFRYPQTDRDALHNISFKINAKDTIAIVGENGSGKSTLIRLITGLYQPTSGDVYINGENSKDLSMKSKFSDSSAVFQKYQRYQMILRKNLILSELDQECTDEKLDNIMKQSGLKKNDSSFKDGYETMLSREFDGVDLSGGQWQRIAIARGYYRRHRLIVLDEPTAAIDPIEETRVYNQFADICKEKTAVIVTHRLGSAKIADRIIVMDQGELVESGGHDELIKADGKYATLYCSQQQWYV